MGAPEGESVTSLPLARQVPFDPSARSYVDFGEFHPLEFTGWQDETMSWKDGCYIHGGLSFLIRTVEVSGPDTMRLLSDLAVNSFDRFPVGSAKHVIFCSERGNVMQHGMALRVAEQRVRSYDLSPYLVFVALSGEYDVEVTDVTDDRFLFQLGGPKSLEIVERAAQQDLHDVPFMKFTQATIAGHEVDVLRMGMGGTLSYEVHGSIEGAHAVYAAIMSAGESFGIRKLGSLAYCCNHTENGFPQAGSHFPLAWLDNPEFAKWAEDILPPFARDSSAIPRGTLTQDIRELFRNPVELGWGHMVSFDHEFVGKAALQKIMAQPVRRIVTLRWNADDILDVFRSYLEKGELFRYMEFPFDFFAGSPGNSRYMADALMRDGRTVGVAMRPTYTLYSREVISLAVVDIDESQLGTELTILWGDWDGPTKEIRAVVSRYPYLDLPSNQDFDLDTIPRFSA